MLEGIHALALDRISLAVPAWDAPLEHLHVPIAPTVQKFVGQTGQVCGARSVKDHGPLSGDLPVALGQLSQREVHRAFDMRDFELLA